MTTGIVRLDKRAWYARGGFRNSRLFRRHRNGRWQYFEDVS